MLRINSNVFHNQWEILFRINISSLDYDDLTKNLKVEYQNKTVGLQNTSSRLRHTYEAFSVTLKFFSYSSQTLHHLSTLFPKFKK